MRRNDDRLRRNAGRVARAMLIVAAALSLVGAAGAQQFIADFGRSGPGRLSDLHVRDVAVDSDGNVWVTDAAVGLTKYDYNGSFIARFGPPLIGQARGIGADADGHVFVADMSINPPRARLRELNTSGELVRDIGGITLNPVDVAIGQDGLILVIDDGTRVRRFDKNGNAVATAAEAFPGGPAGGGMNKIAADGAGHVYIGWQDNRVRRYSEAGDLQVTFGAAEFGAGLFGIMGVAVGPAGRVYVTGASTPPVRVYTPDGTLVGGFGVATRPAQVEQPGDLNGPRGLDVDCRGNIYVTDSTITKDFENQGHVVKFGEPNAPPPPCGPRKPPPAGGFVARADDIEVTQGIQYGDYSPGGRTRNQFGRQPGNLAAYSSGRREVGLAEHAVTVVRVYATLAQGPAGGVANVPATLEGYKVVAGRRVDLGTINADTSPAVLRVSDGAIDTDRRSDPAGAYTFTLPPDWTDGRVALIAHVNPAGIGCNDDVCRNLGRFMLAEIPFRKTLRVTVQPVMLTIGDSKPPRDPAGAFKEARNLSPIPIDVLPFAGSSLDIADIVNARTKTVRKCFLGIDFDPICTDDEVNLTRSDREALVNADIRAWAIANTDPVSGQVPIADVYFGLFRGDASGDVQGAEQGVVHGNPSPIAHSVISRPFTGVAHELFHALGRPHAGTDLACFPDSDGDGKPDQVGESWPPDERGDIQGIGVDRRSGSGGGRGPYRIIAAGVDGGPGEWYDVMSYCNTSESNRWISTHNWQRLLEFLAPGGQPYASVRDPKAPAVESTVGVVGVALTSGSVALSHVGPAATTSRRATQDADDVAGYTIEARAAGGNVVATAPLTAMPLHVHNGGGTATVLAGQVPAAGASLLTVSHNGAVVTAQRRSANAPTVTVSRPKAGARGVDLTWRASDRDGDKLTYGVDYSLDGGRTWHALSVRVTRTRLRVPPASLPASARARLRVRANDGFNETAALSPRFVSRGTPPLVRISVPGPGRTVRADARLTLQGDAVDDMGHRLRGRALTWRLGRRIVGRGEAISAGGLTAGRRTIVLQARDNRGRIGRATVAVRVLPVSPVFLRLDRPARLSRTARHVEFRVATNVPATLVSGSFRAAVGPRTRAVSVPVRPGKTTLQLRLELRAGARKTVSTIEIAR